MYHHYRHKYAPDLDKLWIVTAVSNPARFRSRYDLYHRFERTCKSAGANLMTVELALGDRPFEVTEPNKFNNLQLRSWDEFWHKESMLNAGITRLPRDWKYVAWIDADIDFVRPDWPEEIVHTLQHYEVIQCFQSAVDLGPDGEVIKAFESFMYSYVQGRPWPQGQYYRQWHPGYAWAARREAIDALGGLIDYAILGSADHHMAWALLGAVHHNAPNISKPYSKYLNVWQDRALRHIRKNVGYMKGTINHHWHGRKKDRRYADRWKILQKYNYNPEWDIQRDWQGIYQFSDQGKRMRNEIRAYVHSRNEDSIEL